MAPALGVFGHANCGAAFTSDLRCGHHPVMHRALPAPNRPFFAAVVRALALATTVWPAAATAAPQIRVVSFPPGHYGFMETRVVADGDVAYVTTQDDDANSAHLWTIAVASGRLLDPDGLALPLAIGSNPTVFAGGRLALAGYWSAPFATQGLGVVDVSNPANLALLDVIPVPALGQSLFYQSCPVLAAADGRTAFMVGQNFMTNAEPRLFSFDVETLAAVDPDGLALPGYSDPANLAGDRLLMPDVDNPGLIVVNVISPQNLGPAVRIALPSGSTLISSNNPVASEDGTMAYLGTKQRRVYSFDLDTLALADSDGVAYGNDGLQFPGLQVQGLTLTRNRGRLGAVAGNGLSFADASEPADLGPVADADFGYPQPGMQGLANAGFGSSGRVATVPTLYTTFGSTDIRLFTFDTRNGSGLGSLPICHGNQQANRVTVTGDDTVAVICASTDGTDLYLVYGLLPLFADAFESGGMAGWDDGV